MEEVIWLAVIVLKVGIDYAAQSLGVQIMNGPNGMIRSSIAACR